MIRNPRFDDYPKDEENPKYINPIEWFYFFIIPRWLARRKDVSQTAKLLYGAIDHHMRIKEYLPSQSDLANDIGVSIDTIGRCAKEIRLYMLIEIIRVGKGLPNSYRFLYKTEWITESDIRKEKRKKGDDPVKIKGDPVKIQDLIFKENKDKEYITEMYSVISKKYKIIQFDPLNFEFVFNDYDKDLKKEKPKCYGMEFDASDEECSTCDFMFNCLINNKVQKLNWNNEPGTYEPDNYILIAAVLLYVWNSFIVLFSVNKDDFLNTMMIDNYQLIIGIINKHGVKSIINGIYWFFDFLTKKDINVYDTFAINKIKTLNDFLLRDELIIFFNNQTDNKRGV